MPQDPCLVDPSASGVGMGPPGASDLYGRCLDGNLDWSDQPFDWSDQTLGWADQTLDWADQTLDWSDQNSSHFSGLYLFCLTPSYSNYRN